MAGMSTLQDLFVKELRDIYDAERQITKALPKMIKASESDDLSDALQHHLDVTKAQVERLNQVFGQLDMRPRGHHCPGMAGILEEGAELLDEGNSETSVLEAGLIGAAQRVEHYEIAVYGTLCSFARQLGHDDVAQLLEQTLDEEKAADRLLTEIAQAHVNALAQAGARESMEMGDGEVEMGGRRRRTSGNGHTARASGTSGRAASTRGGSPRKSTAMRGTASSARRSPKSEGTSERAARRR